MLAKELRRELVQSSAIAAAQAELDAARARVAEAEDRLRNLTAPADGRQPPGRAEGFDARELRARIRAWARGRGHRLGERGRIPDALVAQYLDLHPEERTNLT